MTKFEQTKISTAKCCSQNKWLNSNNLFLTAKCCSQNKWLNLNKPKFVQQNVVHRDDS